MIFKVQFCLGRFYSISFKRHFLFLHAMETKTPKGHYFLMQSQSMTHPYVYLCCRLSLSAFICRPWIVLVYSLFWIYSILYSNMDPDSRINWSFFSNLIFPLLRTSRSLISNKENIVFISAAYKSTSCVKGGASNFGKILVPLTPGILELVNASQTRGVTVYNLGYI